MKLRFEIVSHKNQRYETCGDYYQHKGVWWFTISRMKDKRYIYLVLFHEFVEWGLCRLWGIKGREIDRYDIAYEKAREKKGKAPCGCRIKDEPGDDIHAPYHQAHALASQCEQLIAKAIGVDWVSYDEAIAKL